MSQDLWKITAIRLSDDLLRKLPGKGRSSLIRKAIAYYFEARDKRRQIPVPTNEELQALKELSDQLRYIGLNLNQLCMLLHSVPQGRGFLPTDAEVRELHCEIAAISKKARSVVVFWTRP